MQAEIVLLIVVVIAGVFVAVDTAGRQETRESPGELAAGHDRRAEGEADGAGRDDGVAAGQADRRSAGTLPGASRKVSRFALRNWSMRSRLILLVSVPSLGAIVLAVARIISLLHSASMVHGTSAARGRAATSAAVDSLLFVLLLAVAVVITALVGRSMVRPLRKLRTGALEVAGLRLPETVRQMSRNRGEGVSWMSSPSTWTPPTRSAR